MIVKSQKLIAVMAFSLGLNAVAQKPANIAKTETWNLKFPDATASLGACVVGEFLYVHGGHTGATHEYSLDNHSKHFLRLSLGRSNAKWEKLPVGTLAQGFGMVAHGGRIYQIGGSQATNAKGKPPNLRSISKCSVFDPQTLKWSLTTPLPEPRSSHDVALFDGKIYVTGGWDMGNGKPRGKKWYRHGLVADLAQTPLRWRKLPPSDWVVRAHATEVIAGKLYVAGGIDESGTRNTVNVLNLKTGKWSVGPEFPGQGRTKAFGMTLCVWKDRLYASAYSSTIRYLSDDGSRWEDAGIRLQKRRYFHRMVPVGRESLLFVAGANFESHLDTIEEYRVASRNTGKHWPGFRGDGTSHSHASGHPAEWSDSRNVHWRVSLPGYGQSSPVVWNHRIFTTSTKGNQSEKITVTARALATGREIWSKSYASSNPAERSRMISQAAPTPVVDANGLYVFFESGDLMALSHEGQQLWHRNLSKDYGPLAGHHGLGASLAQHQGRLILLLDHPDPSYLLCFEKQTGKTLWEVKRGKRISWATPVVADGALFISSNGILEEVDPANDKQRWYVDGLSGNTVASATVTGNLVFTGSSAKGQCIAVRRGGEGNVSKTHVAWRSQEATSSFGSPLVCRDWVYYVSKAGILYCVDKESGRMIWDRRLSASTWASPVFGDGRLYFFCKDGKALVLGADGSQTVISENTLSVDGPVYGVAMIDNRIIIRSGTNLICIKKQPTIKE